MKRALICGLAVACALPAMAVAKDGWKAPRNAQGQPDVSGSWSNATLTPQARPAGYGTRRALSPAEIAILEGSSAAKDAASRQKVDINATGTASDNVGAYDRTWIDSGVGVMRVGGEPRTSLITTEDGQPPVAHGAARRVLPTGAGSAQAGIEAAKQQASFDQFAAQGSADAGRMGNFDNPESRSVGERCIVGFGRNAGPPMFPNGWYNNNYVIVQGSTDIAIEIEMVHDVRHAVLNGKHRTDNMRPWFGDSIAWYDGDSLVVETDHIPQNQAYYGAWKDLVVTERFTRVAKDRLRYSFSVAAPSTWDKPWGGEYEFHALKGQVFEYACHEGNYALPGILAGARAQEREAAKAPQRGAVGGR